MCCILLLSALSLPESPPCCNFETYLGVENACYCSASHPLLPVMAQKRVQLEKELADIPGERTAADKEQRLTSSIAGLEQQLKYSRFDVTATTDKLAKIATDIQTLTQVRRWQGLLLRFSAQCPLFTPYCRKSPSNDHLDSLAKIAANIQGMTLVICCRFLI